MNDEQDSWLRDVVVMACLRHISLTVSRGSSGRLPSTLNFIQSIGLQPIYLS